MFGKVKLAEISKRLPESGPKTPQIQTEPMSNGLAVCESERRHISPHSGTHTHFHLPRILL